MGRRRGQSCRRRSNQQDFTRAQGWDIPLDAPQGAVKCGDTDLELLNDTMELEGIQHSYLLPNLKSESSRFSAVMYCLLLVLELLKSLLT
jgi:hypothetical protein